VKQAGTGRSANPSVAAVVMLYIDSLPSLTAQARSSSNPWPLFKEDKRFSKLHKFLEKKCCVYLQHLRQWKEPFRMGKFIVLFCAKVLVLVSRPECLGLEFFKKVLTTTLHFASLFTVSILVNYDTVHFSYTTSIYIIYGKQISREVSTSVQ